MYTQASSDLGLRVWIIDVVSAHAVLKSAPGLSVTCACLFACVATWLCVPYVYMRTCTHILYLSPCVKASGFLVRGLAAPLLQPYIIV